MDLTPGNPGAALHDWPAQALLAAYRARSLSPVEVARALLDHLQRWEPHLHASYLLRPELTLAQAAASEARWLRGEPCGVLDGVPVTLKDNIATQGDPTPLGTAAMPLVAAAADAPPAARVREAGAVVIAKTTMPDYGMLSSGLSSFHKLARNPWDLSKTPGGSSAGAGAAAAAGYGPLHIGTDIGGSLRLPAGWCGIFTLKPSLGRIPIDPPYTGRAAGPMTRTVADAALFMQVLTGPDARDSMSLPWQDIAWGDFDQGAGRLKGLRIGLLLEAGCGLAVEPEVRAAVEHAARLFEQAGAIVTPMKPFMTQAMLDGSAHFRLDCQAAPCFQQQPDAKALELVHTRVAAAPVDLLERQVHAVACVRARQHLHEPGRVGDGARHRPCGTAHVRRIDRDAAQAGLEREDAAPTRRQAQRAADVGADVQWPVARGGGRAGAGAGTAGGAGEVPGVARQFVETRQAGRQHPVVWHRGLGNHDAAGFAHPGRGRCVGQGRRQCGRGRSQRRGVALGRDVVLDGHGHAVQRAERRAALPARLACARLLQREFRAQQVEGAQVMFPALDVAEHRLRHFHRREFTPAIRLDQRRRRQLMQCMRVLR